MPDVEVERHRLLVPLRLIVLEPVHVTVEDELILGDAEGVSLTDPVGEPLRHTLAVRHSVEVPEVLGQRDTVGEAVPERDALRQRELVGLRVCVREIVPVRVSLSETLTLGLRE